MDYANWLAKKKVTWRDDEKKGDYAVIDLKQYMKEKDDFCSLYSYIENDSFEDNDIGEMEIKNVFWEKGQKLSLQITAADNTCAIYYGRDEEYLGIVRFGDIGREFEIPDLLDDKLMLETRTGEKISLYNAIKNCEAELMFAYEYQLLGRLKMDCNVFIENEKYYNNGDMDKLWNCSIAKHIEKMREVYESLPDFHKPEWCTLENIENYEKEMNELFRKKIERRQV